MPLVASGGDSDPSMRHATPRNILPAGDCAHLAMQGRAAGLVHHPEIPQAGRPIGKSNPPPPRTAANPRDICGLGAETPQAGRMTSGEGSSEAAAAGCGPVGRAFQVGGNGVGEWTTEARRGSSALRGRTG
jgi:hypothetical protein